MSCVDAATVKAFMDGLVTIAYVGGMSYVLGRLVGLMAKG